MRFDVLSHFTDWVLKQPLMGMAPAAVYDYGPVRSLLLYRDPPFQVELFTIAPGSGFPEEHRHPHVDTFEVHVWGEIVLTVNGQVAEPVRIPQEHGGLLLLTRVRQTDWHGAHPIPGGGAFLSIQHWLDGVAPTSVGLDWEGTPPSPEHAGLLAHRRGES